MSRFRIVIATLVAVAMMSLGAAACTPEQQAEVGPALSGVIAFILLSAVLPALSQHCPPDLLSCPPLG
jgi:hypothetical protein